MNGMDFRPLFWLAMFGLVTLVVLLAFLPLITVWIVTGPELAWTLSGLWAGLVMIAFGAIFLGLTDS